VHKLAGEAVALGYAEYVDSADDARLKLLQFTAKGRAMAASAERELQRIEAELCARIGAERVQQLKDILAMAGSREEEERMASGAAPRSAARP
jgi:DNA-binding MarR family transcriptional regulator